MNQSMNLRAALTLRRSASHAAGDFEMVHESVTTARILELAEEQMYGNRNCGLCLACGEESDECEPDARKYTCEGCGAKRVYGATELFLTLV